MKNRLPSAYHHAIGWHGKLPTVGDFATRRLDTNFIGAWDDWLSAGLAKLRAQDESHWLEAYLSSPTWRFLLTPGFLPAPLHNQVWTGVVMPSVDRVGRYYPLTLAAPLSALPGAHDAQVALWSWLQSLEDAAIDALQEDWSIDQLETELLRLGLPPDPSESRAGAGSAAATPTPDPFGPASLESFFAACAAPPVAATGAARCLWYNEADLNTPKMLCSAAMDNSILQLWRG